MARAPSFCGVVLAAGASSRMGRDKALLPWRGGTFLSETIDLLVPYTDLVIVVGGENRTTVESIVHSAGAFLVVNREPERGQFSSLRIGIQEVLNRGRDAAIISLVDRPPCRPETVAQLKNRFLQRAPEGVWAVVPRYQEHHGHPILVGREMIDAFLRAPAGSTARDVEHQNTSRIEYAAVDDAMVVANVDTPEDYERIVHG